MRLTDSERKILEIFCCLCISIGVYGMSQSSNTLALFWLAVALAWPHTASRALRLTGWTLRGTFFLIVLYSFLSEVLV